MIADKNQLYLDIGLQIAVKKKDRIKKLHDQKTYFSYPKHQLSLENLIKITYDITDKDFEYFYAYILEQEWYDSVHVLGGENDNGVDIIAKKDGTTYLIQCKQWSDLSIDIKRVGQIYTRMYHEKFIHEYSILRIVTTSYFDQLATEFLNWNSVEFVDNIKLIKFCEDHNYFTENKWKEIRIKIYQKRLEWLRDNDILNIKEFLKNKRINEAKNHISPEYRKTVWFVNSRESIIYRNKLFQYWNLV